MVVHRKLCPAVVNVAGGLIELVAARCAPRSCSILLALSTTAGQQTSKLRLKATALTRLHVVFCRSHLHGLDSFDSICMSVIRDCQCAS